MEEFDLHSAKNLQVSFLHIPWPALAEIFLLLPKAKFIFPLQFFHLLGDLTPIHCTFGHSRDPWARISLTETFGFSQQKSLASSAQAVPGWHPQTALENQTGCYLPLVSWRPRRGSRCFWRTVPPMQMLQVGRAAVPLDWTLLSPSSRGSRSQQVPESATMCWVWWRAPKGTASAQEPGTTMQFKCAALVCMDVPSKQPAPLHIHFLSPQFGISYFYLQRLDFSWETQSYTGQSWLHMSAVWLAKSLAFVVLDMSLCFFWFLLFSFLL